MDTTTAKQNGSYGGDHNTESATRNGVTKHSTAAGQETEKMLRDDDHSNGDKVKAKVKEDAEATKKVKDKARMAEEGGRGDETSRLSSSSSSSSSSEEDSSSSRDSDISPTNPAQRASWNNKLGFILTCVSFSVGLGNVWRFPYLCYKNGGGAFLLPFIIVLVLVGMPLFFMELALGQFASLGPIAVWKINPLFKGLGYGMVSVSWLVAVYYNVVIAQVILFLIMSLRSLIWGLPWTTCGNDWNTPLCLEQQYKETWQTVFDGNTTDSNVTATTAASTTTTFTTVASMATGNVTQTFFNLSGKRNTPAEEYYNNYILEISEGIDDDGTVNWKLALCLLLAWAIVLLCLLKGIKSMGKVVYFTALFPYVMLFILLIRGLTLPGAIDGVIFYVKPDWDKLWTITVWSDAATQIFYSLSCCCGGLIAMASYNDFNYNCLRDSMIVPIINCLTSVFAGFVIFSILGFMAYEKGVDVKDVATGGPGLAFVVYPEALSRMPLPQVWAIFFFFMMAVLGFGSEFSIVECVLSALTDEFPSILRNKYNSYIFRTVIILGTFLLGLPMVTRNGMYLLNLVDASVSGFPLLVIGIFECVAISWIYGISNFSDDIHMMLGVRPNIFWKVCWMFVAPGVFLGLLICGTVFYQVPMMGEYSYPNWAVGLGWLIGLFPILLLPLYAAYYGCRHGGLQLCRSHMKPVDQWGPALREHREGTHYEGTSGMKLADMQFGVRTYNFNFEIEGMAGEFLAKYADAPPPTESKSLATLAQCFIGSSAKDADDSQIVGKNSGKFPVQVSRSDYILGSCANCALSSQSPINELQPPPLCKFCNSGNVAAIDEATEPQLNGNAEIVVSDNKDKDKVTA